MIELIEKVTRPVTIVTDPVVLKRLKEQGIDKNYVEFWHDYAPRNRGKEYSPYTKFYRDLKSNKKIMVSQGLPMVDAYGFKHELVWRERNGVIENGNNIFHSIIDNGTIRIIVLSDQPYNVKRDTELSYHAQLFINGSEILPTSVVPLILATDPVNPNYHDNVILWQYDTICRRRVRIMPGRYREWWLIDANPNGRVEVRHNKTGALQLKLGTARDAEGEILKVRVVGDSEIIEASEFDGKTFPVEIRASATFYPDAHVESSSVDGRVQRANRDETWATIRSSAGTIGRDDETAEWGSFFQASVTNNQWRTLGRAIFLFDVSGLPDSNTITAVVFSVRGESKVNDLGASPDINVYASTPASNTALEASDYMDVLSDPYCDTPITYADFTTVGYNDFTLNADPGIVAAQAASDGNTVLKLGTRNANYDVVNSPPTWQSGQLYNGLRVYFADYGSNKPKLVVTYTVPEPTNYDRSAIVLIGNKVTASRSIATSRASSVILGIVTTASRAVNNSRASSVIVGAVVTASRAVAVTRSAVVAIGVLVSASEVFGTSVASSVIVGIVATASGLLTLGRSASVQIGAMVTATRAITYNRSASVIVGIIATASRIHGRIREATVSVGNVVTAAYNTGRKLFITVIASQYRRIRSFTFGG